MAEVARVLAYNTVDLVDPSAISSCQVEVAPDDTLVPEIDVGTQSVHTNLSNNVAEKIFDESPSHDLQQVMEGEDETGKVLLISPIRNLVSEDPSSIEVVPVEGISPSLFLFSSSFF